MINCWFGALWVSIPWVPWRAVGCESKWSFQMAWFLMKWWIGWIDAIDSKGHHVVGVGQIWDSTPNWLLFLLTQHDPSIFCRIDDLDQTLLLLKQTFGLALLLSFCLSGLTVTEEKRSCWVKRIFRSQSQCKIAVIVKYDCRTHGFFASWLEDFWVFGTTVAAVVATCKASL